MAKAQKVTPVDEYVEEMLYARRYSTGLIWYADNIRDDRMAVAIFMAIKRIICINRCKETKYQHNADGQQIQRRLAPDWKGFSADWIARSGAGPAFENLIKAGLITKTMKNEPPYGYGSDQLYGFSALSKRLIKEAKDLRHLREAVKAVIHDQLTRGTQLKEEIDVED